ncbi:MAG: ATP-binding cassette domain-containing protein [Bacillus subtilis]|nr:ATP-binding cassette domain-containing protein [Bacillus subtilis]
MNAIQTDQLTRSFGEPEGGRPPDAGNPARHGLRLSWSERLRQDDHHPPPARSAGCRSRLGAGAGLRYEATARRGPRAMRGAARASRLVRAPVRGGEPDYYGRIWRMSKADREKRIREMLEPLDLYERRGEPIGRWSRGMKQKLAVARTLMHRPELIFLDEPTAGLDPVASSALRDDLSKLVAQEGVTIFLTTHNLAEC